MKEAEALQKHTLNLREGDMDKLRDLVPDLAPAVLIRLIVSTFVDRHEGVATINLAELDVKI